MLGYFFFNKILNDCRSFAYAAPFFWNHLPNNVRFAHAYLSFRQKTFKHISLIKHFLHRLPSAHPVLGLI